MPEIFGLIQREGQVDEMEMFDVFNMGVGFVLVVSPEEVEEVRRLAAEPLYLIGEVVRGGGVSFA